MLMLPKAVRIYLATQPTDLRRGFDGLAAKVVEQGLDLYSGHLFVFLSKDRTKVKILTWDRGGFVLWYKRFERGCIKRPQAIGQANMELDAGQLHLLLEGIDLHKVKRIKGWEPPGVAASH